MDSLRFSLTNLLQSATLKNGTGGGAPARDEVSPWVMENALDRDRGHVWQGAATVNYDALLPSADSVEVFAMLGRRPAPNGGAGITSVAFKHQSGAYTPGGAFTTAGTTGFSPTQRDGGVIATAIVDTLRFTVTASTGYTVGRLWAGSINDLECVSSPGYSRRWIDPYLESRMADQSPFITYTGEGHWEYTLPYEGADSNLYEFLREVGQTRHTFVLIDRDSTIYEARVRAPFEHTLMHDFPDWQNTALVLETLG